MGHRAVFPHIGNVPQHEMCRANLDLVTVSDESPEVRATTDQFA